MSTPKIVQIAGSAASQQDLYIGQSREVTFDTSRNELRVHDGVTPGGHRIPNTATILQLMTQYLIGGLVKAEIVLTNPPEAVIAAHEPDATALLFVPWTATAIPGEPTFAGLWMWSGTDYSASPYKGAMIQSNVTGWWVNVTGSLMTNDGAAMPSDWNNALMPGVYYTTNSAGHTNTPIGGAVGWQIQVFRHTSSTWLTQIAWPLSATAEPWVRSNSGSWLAWRKLAVDGVTVDTYNAVGSYLFATNAGATTVPGATVAGSSLTPSAHDNASTGGARAGTWKAMGNGVTAKSTLWIKAT